jgi:membrane-associated protease RseP (regulator of RpoE activity)
MHMFSTALNSLVLALLLLVPTASARATDDSKGKSSDDRVVVRVGGDDLEVDGDEPEVVGDHPIVIRVGRGGFMGVRLIGITEELRSHYGAPKDAGVLVGEVEAGSPAARAGIEVGDVITMVGGERVSSTRDVSRRIRDKKGGEAVDVEIVRGRSPRKVTVTLEERKSQERTIDLGDLDDHADHADRHAWVWKDGDFQMPRFKVENLEELPSLRERLEDLEKRLRELEKKVR